MLVKTAATFDVAVKEIFWPLTRGRHRRARPARAERDPGALLACSTSQRITICHLVPSLLRSAWKPRNRPDGRSDPHLAT